MTSESMAVGYDPSRRGGEPSCPHHPASSGNLLRSRGFLARMRVILATAVLMAGLAAVPVRADEVEAPQHAIAQGGTLSFTFENDLFGTIIFDVTEVVLEVISENIIEDHIGELMRCLIWILGFKNDLLFAIGSFKRFHCFF